MFLDYQNEIGDADMHSPYAQRRYWLRVYSLYSKSRYRKRCRSSLQDTLIDYLTPFYKGKPYHSRYSGYERLIDFVDANLVFHCPTPPFNFAYRPFRMARFVSKFYGAFEAELIALSGNGNILHHLYGEDSFFLCALGFLKKRKRIVVTFHQTPDRFIKIMPIHWRGLLRNIDQIIVLSPSQYFFLREQNHLHDSINLIPHGIDIDYFTPSTDTVREKFSILSVGNHLRDYTTLLKAMKVVNSKMPNLELTIVSSSIESTQKNLSVVVRRKISDSKLLELYRCSSFLVLPVQEVTASNTLLEGMACGLPVICPRLDDIVFHTANQGCLYYEVGNESDLAEKILYLASSSEKQKATMGKKARKRAKQFSWKKIAAKIERVYESSMEIGTG